MDRDFPQAAGEAFGPDAGARPVEALPRQDARRPADLVAPEQADATSEERRLFVRVQELGVKAGRAAALKVAKV